MRRRSYLTLAIFCSKFSLITQFYLQFGIADVILKHFHCKVQIDLEEEITLGSAVDPPNESPPFSEAFQPCLPVKFASEAADLRRSDRR